MAIKHIKPRITNPDAPLATNFDMNNNGSQSNAWRKTTTTISHFLDLKVSLAFIADSWKKEANKSGTEASNDIIMLEALRNKAKGAMNGVVKPSIRLKKEPSIIEKVKLLFIFLLSGSLLLKVFLIMSPSWKEVIYKI
jgi:hypothetical protein